MSENNQQELKSEIQRLLTLLDVKTSIYNIEVRECTNGKAYIIESPNKPNAPQYIMDITSAINDLNYRSEYDYICMLKDMKLEMKKRQMQ